MRRPHGRPGPRQRALLPALAALAALLTGCASAPEAVDPDAPIYYPPPPDPPRYVHEFTLRESSDVVQETETERLRRQMTGAAERSVAFDKPFDIAARGGRIYVTDSMAGTVHAFDIPRRRYWQFGFRFEGDLSKPTGVSVDHNGMVYVADTQRQTVVIYDNLGLYQRHVGDQQTLQRPVAAAASADGSRIFVVDAGGVESDLHRIQVFDADGVLVHSIGRRGDRPGEFNLPADIAIGPDERLYVLDAGNFRVQVLEADGTPVTSWGSVGRSFGQFARPRALAVSDQGLVMVSDAMFGNVQIFDDQGRLLLPVGRSSDVDQRAAFGLLAGVAADETGRLYAVDQIHRKVEIFRYLEQEPPG